jgi:hypothetical protein
MKLVDLLLKTCMPAAFAWILAGWYGCGSVGKQGVTASSWMENHPVSRTHFVGVGSAKVEGDLYSAQVLARKRALMDIAEQIRVSIVSDVALYTRSNVRNSKELNSGSYREKIVALSQAMLCGWEEIRTGRSNDGYYWSKVVLSKKRYYAQVREKINTAVKRICDIIENAHTGSAAFRMAELCRGFAPLDEFFETPLYGRIQGHEVLLSNELGRRVRKLLEGISIKPVSSHPALPAARSGASSLGVKIFCDGAPDTSLTITWSASEPAVVVNAVERSCDGTYRAVVSAIPAGVGMVTITARPDFDGMNYDLIRRKFVIPSASMVIHRDKAQVFIDNQTFFSKQLARELSEKGACIVVNNRNDAEFVLQSHLTADSTVTMEQSLYIAGADLALALFVRDGNAVFAFHQTVQSADGISAERAQENTRRCALEIAFKQVMTRF